jgi:hypothetical protein
MSRCVVHISARKSRNMELVHIALVFVAAHLLVVYYGVYVARLEYAQVIALIATVSVVSSVLVRLTEPEWKPRLVAAIQSDERQGRAFADVLGMIGVFIGGSLVSAFMIGRRYGWTGWLGAVGTQAAVHAVL